MGTTARTILCIVALAVALTASPHVMPTDTGGPGVTAIGVETAVS